MNVDGSFCEREGTKDGTDPTAAPCCCAVQQNGPAPEARAKQWLWQLLDGVRHFHAHQICHRDLKLENVLLTRDQQGVKIADFGVASPLLLFQLSLLARPFQKMNGQRVIAQECSVDFSQHQYLSVRFNTLSLSPFSAHRDVQGFQHIERANAH
eukprot:SAG11_NODE_225_length_12064_cov_7.850815_14_plen_154_part_00